MSRIRTTRQARKCRVIALWGREESTRGGMAEEIDFEALWDHELNREMATAFLAKREQMNQEGTS